MTDHRCVSPDHHQAALDVHAELRKQKVFVPSLIQTERILKIYDQRQLRER